MIAAQTKKWWLTLAILCVLAPLVGAQSPGAANEEKEDRTRVAWIIEVLPGGSAEKALMAYQDWVKKHGSKVPLDGSVPFDKLNPDQKKLVKEMMTDLYNAAGDGDKGFKNAALVLDRALGAPSEDFTKGGYKNEKIPDTVSVLMAQARDAFIEDTIKQVAHGKKPPIKVCRSDSGNTTSGMKSDLDQTFYVYEWDEKTQDWVRDPKRAKEMDAKFIAEFNQAWGRNYGALTQGRLDIASIPGSSRFPDVRVTDSVAHGKKVRTTITELRLTPGAYTTYGAVLQQMQLRALGGIIAAAEKPDDMGRRRAFQQYTRDGKITHDAEGKLIGFDEQLARKTMFGQDLDPRIRHGMAFGAAVANLIELEHYMNESKFETKYHLRVWDDGEYTRRIVSQGGEADAKEDYTKLSPDERMALNREMLAEMFEGDPRAQSRHALALEASAAMRLVHKGDLGKIDAFKGLTKEQFHALPEIERSRPVFEPLSREMFPAEWAQIDEVVEKKSLSPEKIQERIEKVIRNTEQQHRTISAEFCLRSVCINSREMLGLMFELDAREPLLIDLKKVRDAAQGVPKIPFSLEHHDQEWKKIKKNLRAEARETILFAFYDLGPTEAMKLRDYMKEKYPDFSTKIDKLYEDSRWQGWEAFKENKALYGRYYKRKAKQSFDALKLNVLRHTLNEFGFRNVDQVHSASQLLRAQNVTWSFSKLARNAVADPGGLDAAAQICRSVFESGGDIDVVMACVGREMLFAIPVIGQVASVSQGGYMGAGMMVVAMKLPPAGVVMIAYGIGDAVYAIYDMEYQRPKRENVIDAVFRGFAGPEDKSYGEPGQPPPQWNDTDDQTLAAAEQRYARASAGAAPKSFGSFQGPIDNEETRKLKRNLEALQHRKAAYKAYVNEGASALGGLVFGENAVAKRTPIKTCILADVKPEIGFLTKGVVDRRIKDDNFDPESYKGRKKELEARVANESDVMDAIDASAELHELNQQWRRHAYSEAIGTSQTLEDRFKRDSFYIHLRDTLGMTNTTDKSMDMWTHLWFVRHEKAVIQEMVDAGLLDEDALTWRQRGEQAADAAEIRLAASQGGGSTKVDRKAIIQGYCPIDLDLLKARVRNEVDRSRRLFAAYVKAEKDRKAASRRNVETAKEKFAVEMARPNEDELEEEGGVRDLVAAARYFAVPRHAPRLEATIYKEAVRADASKTDQYVATTKYDFSFSSKITADPTLYFAPYKVEPKVINVAGGKMQGAPQHVLPPTRKVIDLLLDLNKNKTGRIILVSAYAAGMADLTNAMPETVEHLPKIKTPSGYLMDQAAAFIEAPPPPRTIAGTWGALQMLALGPVRFQLEEHEDGVVTGRLRSTVQEYDENDPQQRRAWHYRYLRVDEFKGKRTGPHRALLFGIGRYRGADRKFRLDVWLTQKDDIEHLNFGIRYASPTIKDDHPALYWKGYSQGSFTKRSDYNAMGFTDEDRAERARYAKPRK